MAKRRILVDFDNTFSLPGCDVDDALALLYLIGCDDVKIEGICTTYGNSTLDAVHADTEKLMRDWKIDVPLQRGASSPLSELTADGSTDAAELIARACSKSPRSVDILATGSTTNLGLAERLHPGILAQARSITLMGGITESLVINGRIMDELNLSCDPQATLTVLGADTEKAIATSKNCLPAFFTRGDMKSVFPPNSQEWAVCEEWFDTMDAQYDWMGWTCWDVVAAAHIVHPELFIEDMHAVTLYERFLKVGYLECDREDGAPARSVNLPIIRDTTEFKQHVLHAWQRGYQACSVI